MAKRSSKKSRLSFVHRRRSVAVLAILLIGLLLVLEISNTTHLFHKTPTKTAVIPTTPKATPNNPGNSQNQGTPANPSSGSNKDLSKDSSVGTPDTSRTLIAPWGTFVSNHKPGKNGAPTQETSVCKTTPGATCYIKFTNGDLTRTLPTKVADNDGVVYWNWDIKDAGFSQGSWQITAIAYLNGQTATATDSLALEV